MKLTQFIPKDIKIGKFKVSTSLLIICAFFLLTRFIQISQNPPSLYWDEASIGYNAYSIMQTGKDEWGDSFPIHFRAFGEFKLPVYIYSTVFTEIVFGLTPVGIRLPAVLYSLGSLILIYLLVKKLTKQELPAIFAAFAFALSPWMFIFSRVGYEATSGLFFFLLAIYFFIQSQRKSMYFLLFVISLVTTLYSYNSFRILSSLTIVAGSAQFLWNSRTRKSIIICFVGLIIFAVSLIPIARVLLYDAGFSRSATFALLPNIQQVYDLKGKPHYQIIFDRSHENDWSKNMILISQNYFSHFSRKFLFNGDSNSRNQQPGFGQIYYIDVFLIFFGLLVLFKQRKFVIGLVLFLLFISPIPASLFKEAPHSLRAILMAPVLSILIGLGMWWVVKRWKRMLIPLVVVYLVFFGFYFLNFLTIYPIKTSADFQYPYKVIFDQYSNQFNNFDNIIITDDFAQPYIFPITYLKVNPDDFQKNAKRNSIDQWGFSTVSEFDKFKFVKENNSLEFPGKSLLFLRKPLVGKYPAGQINYLDGKEALYVYKIEK